MKTKIDALNSRAVSTVADVRISLLRAPSPERIGMAFGDLNTRSLVLIAIESTDGLVGYGESWVNHPDWAGFERLFTLQQGVVPILRGRNAADIGAIHRDLLDQLRPLGIPWGAPGPIMQAISGINMALWDLLGKSLGTSVATLFGGRVRDRVRVYASSLGPEGVAEGAARCRELGFTAAKVRVGFGNDIDAQNLRSARKHLGDEAELLVDVNQAWNLRQALEAAPLLHELGVSWVEEPLRGNDLSQLEELHERSGLRLATGENLYGRDGFAAYLLSPHVEILQPDLAKGGGFSEILPVVQMAEALEKLIIPHLYGGAVAFAATLQLAACTPVVDMLEYDIRSNPLRDPLMATPIDVVDGWVAIPDGPGIGVNLDFDAVRDVEIHAISADSGVEHLLRAVGVDDPDPSAVR